MRQETHTPGMVEGWGGINKKQLELQFLTKKQVI